MNAYRIELGREMYLAYDEYIQSLSQDDLPFYGPIFRPDSGMSLDRICWNYDRIVEVYETTPLSSHYLNGWEKEAVRYKLISYNRVINKVECNVEFAVSIGPNPMFFSDDERISRGCHWRLLGIKRKFKT